MSDFMNTMHGGEENYKRRQMLDRGITAMNVLIVMTSYVLVGVPTISLFLFIFSDIMSEVWGRAVIAVVGALIINYFANGFKTTWKNEKDAMFKEMMERLDFNAQEMFHNLREKSA